MHSFMKKFVNFLFCHLFYQVEYFHLENLEKYPEYLICPNHSHVLDPTFIYPIIDNLYIMAKADLFKNKLLAKLFNHYQIFPIHREKTDSKSLFYSLEIFEKQDHAKLLMFPEGGILKEADLGKKFRKGAVFIASQARVPIIPVLITRKPKLFSKVKVTFGEPIFYDENLTKDKQKILEESQNLIQIIYHLK